MACHENLFVKRMNVHYTYANYTKLSACFYNTNMGKC